MRQKRIIFIIIVIIWGVRADPRASVVQLHDCRRDVFLNIPRDRQGYFLPNSSLNWEVSAAGLDCLTNLSTTIVKFTGEKCKDNIKIKEINPERVLYDSCKDEKQSFIFSRENKIMIYFVSDQDGKGKVTISVKCTQNTSTCMSRTRISGTLSQFTPTTQTNSALSKMSTIIGDKRDSTEASEVNSVQTRSAFFTENKEITVRGNSSKSFSGTILTKRSTTQVSTDVQDVKVDSDVTVFIVVCTVLVIGVISFTIVVGCIIKRKRYQRNIIRKVNPQLSLYAKIDECGDLSNDNAISQNFECNAITVPPQEDSKFSCSGTNASGSAIQETKDARTLEINRQPNHALVVNKSGFDSQNQSAILVLKYEENNESNPYMENALYDALYCPRPKVYEKASNTYGEGMFNDTKCIQ
uniref:Uncharacterized protein LOC111102085 n=1 Tax=Crassostrea virginica TaxID=6565 RepID=A0A8B8AG55_CRAVI|nr:uncharacterized protein LOC111102085 [Crassostrea virginica]